MRVAANGSNLRRRLYVAFDPLARPDGLSPLNIGLCFVILASVSATILETEPAIARGREHLFRAVEIGFGALFAIEYLARLWVAPEREPQTPANRARWRWALSPPALIDLASLLLT